MLCLKIVYSLICTNSLKVIPTRLCLCRLEGLRRNYS